MEFMSDVKRSFPFEATITPDVLGRGHHWITVQLKNVSTERLFELGVTLYDVDPFQVEVLPGAFQFIEELAPQETKRLKFLVNANHTGWVYLNVTTAS
ncbi:MAG: hypothetical protein ACXV76_10850, partial [Halobacteriota archaeon]